MTRRIFLSSTILLTAFTSTLSASPLRFTSNESKSVDTNEMNFKELFIQLKKAQDERNYPKLLSLHDSIHEFENVDKVIISLQAIKKNNQELFCQLVEASKYSSKGTKSAFKRALLSDMSAFSDYAQENELLDGPRNESQTALLNEATTEAVHLT